MKMNAQSMKTLTMTHEKSDSSDDEDVDHDSYKKCGGCKNWEYQLIYCSICKKAYHNDCHIPPLPKTMDYSNLASFEFWICTMCIDIDRISKMIIEEEKDSNKKTLDKKRIIMASRILLELLSDEQNCAVFIDCPLPKHLFLDYYRVIFRPVSINKVKKRLFKKKYYASLTDVIKDIKRIYSNALFYYPKGDPYKIMAQKQEGVLNEMLAKWVP